MTLDICDNCGGRIHPNFAKWRTGHGGEDLVLCEACADAHDGKVVTEGPRESEQLNLDMETA